QFGSATREGQDLAKLIAQHGAALKARQDGALLVRQAQGAVRLGKGQEASALLKAANANQFLAPQDKQLAANLNDRLRGVPSANAPMVPGVTVSNRGPVVDIGIVYNENDPKSIL